jgi:hypothetical protein
MLALIVDDSPGCVVYFPVRRSVERERADAATPMRVSACPAP